MTASTVSSSSRPQGENGERHAERFPVGFYQLHPDVSVNYQMNRFSTGEADMAEEMRAIASRIHDYSDYTREFLALAQNALRRAEKLKGAYYLRSAEFYMFANDPRKQDTRRQYLQLMRDSYGFTDNDHFAVPYQGGALSAFRKTTPHPKGAIVLFAGFDSYVEEMFPMQGFFQEAGYDVVSFDGPGQGVPLEDGHMAMTHEWHKPVKAVLDYFQLDNVTLIGVSLGGCLAIRAAAYEPRVHRVVADDILTNFFETILRQLSPGVRGGLSLLLNTGASKIVNTLLGRAMKQSLVTDWGMQQGMLVTGSRTPYDFLKRAQMFRTDEVSALVKQDVLLLGGVEDHYVPLHQFYDQVRSLSHARSLTARLFTRQEQAQNHVQVGNLGLQFRVIREWIELMQGQDEPSAAQEGNSRRG